MKKLLIVLPLALTALPAQSGSGLNEGSSHFQIAQVRGPKVDASSLRRIMIRTGQREYRDQCSRSGLPRFVINQDRTKVKDVLVRITAIYHGERTIKYRSFRVQPGSKTFIGCRDNGANVVTRYQYEAISAEDVASVTPSGVARPYIKSDWTGRRCPRQGGAVYVVNPDARYSKTVQIRIESRHRGSSSTRFKTVRISAKGKVFLGCGHNGSNVTTDYKYSVKNVL